MNDATFRALQHVAENYIVTGRGHKLVDGYKPDAVLNFESNYIIMECDTGTTRKGFLGGMIKAAKFLTENRNGVFIAVVAERDNTKAQQIFKHLSPYFEWVKPITNLSALYVISSIDYCCNEKPLEIFSKPFNVKAMALFR